ncbi:hypothetical protein CC78DRAFT_578882 [Lojkania enalia]|uniref:Uncharacterized protein n=1 Tax=Lojkania enalia TaxID=147567 RepID=A0A9P4KAK8_9PLEO|nr:hypothetical protein CC78DRAFT_578882 [Didymosphaeria enalia]
MSTPGSHQHWQHIHLLASAAGSGGSELTTQQEVPTAVAVERTQHCTGLRIELQLKQLVTWSAICMVQILSSILERRDQGTPQCRAEGPKIIPGKPSGCGATPPMCVWRNLASRMPCMHASAVVATHPRAFSPAYRSTPLRIPLDLAKLQAMRVYVRKRNVIVLRLFKYPRRLFVLCNVDLAYEWVTARTFQATGL